MTGDRAVTMRSGKAARGVGSPVAEAPSTTGIDLYWMPLGADGWFVRMNGRIYEAVVAFLGSRRPLDLFHATLEVHLPEGRFVTEMTPILNSDQASRGVVGEGPVGSRLLVRFRVFRYELRRWPDGMMPLARWAVDSPQRLTEDPRSARRLFDLVPAVPRLVWGRDELGAGEMWNSNSVISWLLARSGLPAHDIPPPAGGRAPGWRAGLVASRRVD